MYLGQTTFVHQHLSLLGMLWISNNIFIIIDQHIFFYFGDKPWYSDECAWRLHYIPYLGGLRFFCFFFFTYLKQKQWYVACSVSENDNFISFHGRILSEINKFIKLARTFLSKNNKKKPTKKTGSSKRWLFVSLAIHHIEILNTEVQKQIFFCRKQIFFL